jgi:hydroxymethylcytosylglucuronate/cytosylglucuronate synthase
VDSLPFLWTAADDVPFEVAAYCAQRSPTLPQACLEPLSRVERLSWVGAIVSPVPDRVRHEWLALLNLGGLHSPSNPGGNPSYLRLVLPPVLRALDAAGFEAVQVCGNVRDADIRALVPATALDISVHRLPHEAFLDRLASAGLLVTSPGLTTLLEASAAGTATICMPPQNLSQVFNGDRFAAAVGSDLRVAWPEQVLCRQALEEVRRDGEEAALSMIDHALATAATADTAAVHRHIAEAMAQALDAVPLVPSWDGLVAAVDRRGAADIAGVVLRVLAGAAAPALAG